AAFQRQSPAAFHTGISVPDPGDICESAGPDIPRYTYTLYMVVSFVGAPDQTSFIFQRNVIYNVSLCAVEADSTDIPETQAGIFMICEGEYFCSYGISQLGFIHLQIAAYKHDQRFSAVFYSEDRSLHQSVRGGAEEVGQGIDIFYAGSVDLLKGLFLCRDMADARYGHFCIGFIVTLLTNGNGIFSCLGQQHEFMGDVPAHHAA